MYRSRPIACTCAARAGRYLAPGCSSAPAAKTQTGSAGATDHANQLGVTVRAMENSLCDWQKGL